MKKSSAQERVKRAIMGDAAIIGTMAKIIKEKYGNEGLEAIRDGLEKSFPSLMKRLAKEAGVKTGDGTIADWAKLEKLICSVSGMEFLTEVTPTRGSVKITYCPMATQYQRTSPDLCRMMFIGIERAIASTINPRMKVHGARYIPDGDEYCEIICELKD